MAKFLVVGPSWVGDMVMAQSLFKQLRADDPEALIDVVAPAWSGPLLARMPEVRRAVVLPVGHGELALGKRRAIGRSLRAERYDQAIVLPRSWKSALVPFFAGIPKRTGFHGEQRYLLLTERRKLDKRILDQTVKRFVSLGLPAAQAYPPPALPQPQLRVDPDNQRQLLTQLGLSLERPVIAMMPGAEYGPAKQWPLSYFAELAERLVAHGYQVWVLGGPKDQADGARIAPADAAHRYNLCGKTRLEDAVDLLALARKAVTNDSGLMHVAAAVGVHIEALYGSSSPHFTPPLTERKTIHYLALECSPCFKRQCPLGHTHCLQQIGVEQVMASVLQPLA